MSVLHFFQDEKLFPVLTFFEKRRRAEAHLDPPYASIVAGAGVRNVAKVFVAGDRALAERARIDCGAQRRLICRASHARSPDNARLLLCQNRSGTYGSVKGCVGSKAAQFGGDALRLGLAREEAPQRASDSCL